MKSHPYADLFPMMNDTEFDALCADIEQDAVNKTRDKLAKL